MKAIPHKMISVLVLISLFVCLYGLTGLNTNADYRVYFDKNDPLLQMDARLGEKYARLDSLIVIFSATKDTLLEPSLLKFYPELEKHVYNIEHVKAVTGFFQFLDEDINFNDESIASIDDPEYLLQKLRTQSRSTNLITADGLIGLLNIGVTLPGINTAKEVKRFMSEFESVVDSQINKNNLNITVNYSGTLALNEAYIDVVRHDLKRFVPFLFLIFSICLFYFFRNWGVTFLLIVTALLSAISAFGIAGWLNWELAAINAFTPIIIMSLNIATSMHIVVNYFRFVAEGLSRSEAMSESICYNLYALSLSKLTTSIGFLLLAFSPSPPVNVVGYIVAIGMVISYVLCLTVFRSLLPLIPLSSEKAKIVVKRFSLRKLGETTLKFNNKILIFSAVIFIISLNVIQQLKINDNVYEYFPDDHRFREGTTIIDNRFDGSIRLLYSLDSGSSSGVIDPGFVDHFNEFTNWLRGQDPVSRVDDVLSLVSRQGIRLDNVKSILKTNSPAMLGLEQELDDAYRSVKVSVILKSMTARELIAFDKKTKNWLDNNLTSYNYEGGVGPDILFAKLGERNAKSMFFSLSMALVMIALVVGILLRSWSAIFIALICNIFPVLIVFSIWAFVGGYISLGSAMVMGMILGIVVDDTLHMLLKIPATTKDTITNTVHLLFDKVCPAILITSITLAAGLSVGVFSDFRPIYELSLLSLSIILVAMLADLFLLPALMNIMKLRRA